MMDATSEDELDNVRLTMAATSGKAHPRGPVRTIDLQSGKDPDILFLRGPTRKRPPARTP